MAAGCLLGDECLKLAQTGIANCPLKRTASPVLTEGFSASKLAQTGVSVFLTDPFSGWLSLSSLRGVCGAQVFRD